MNELRKHNIDINTVELSVLARGYRLEQADGLRDNKCCPPLVTRAAIRVLQRLFSAPPALYTDFRLSSARYLDVHYHLPVPSGTSLRVL